LAGWALAELVKGDGTGGAARARRSATLCGLLLISNTGPRRLCYPNCHTFALLRTYRSGQGFGWWHWTDAQIGVVVGISAALLSMFVRSQVTPLIRPLDAGRPLISDHSS
jgi:hypothetical protein